MIVHTMIGHLSTVQAKCLWYYWWQVPDLLSTCIEAHKTKLASQVVLNTNTSSYM